MSHRLLVVVSLSLLFGLAGVATAQETARGRVILVLDASGSMWGQIDGRAKIEIARDVIRDMLGDWDPQLALGLMAYGHRRKGDCADIEALIPAGTGTTQAVLGAVHGLNPKGKTPLSSAVSKAADALRFTEERATVVLVSDGIETCTGDPCAVASRLEQQGVDFTVHVVGFDVAREEQEQLRCIAENTGGRFLPASNAASLNQALQTVVAEVVQAEPEPEVVRVATGGPGQIKLQAVLSPEHEPLQKNVVWKVYQAQADFEGNRERVGYEIKPSHVFSLPAGRYLVTADFGDTSAREEIEVQPGEKRVHTVDLNAGQVKLDAVLVPGGERFAKNVVWKIYEAKADFEGKRKRAAYEIKPQHIFTLPAGRYLVTAAFGSAAAEEEISVGAGAQFAHTVALHAGQLKTLARWGPENAQIQSNVVWKIYQAQADFEGNRKRVAYEITPSYIFTLPAGDYLLTAEYKNIEAEQRFSLAAGQQKVLEVVFE